MRAMFWAGSMVLGLAVLIGAGRLWAESKKSDKQAAPRTRIALVNITYVMKNWEKYTKFQEEMKKFVAPFEKRHMKLRAQAEKLSKAKGESTIAPAKAEDTDEELKHLQREIEENSEKAKKFLQKKGDEQMKLLFKEMQETIRRYAPVHDLDLVLHYNDAITEEDFMSPANIARKLQTGALMPIYAAQGMDISKEIADILNQNYRKETTMP